MEAIAPDLTHGWRVAANARAIAPTLLETRLAGGPRHR